MNETLLKLLRFAKQTDKPFTWDSVRDECLTSLYHKDMLLVDVLNVVSIAHKELIQEPQFQVSTNLELFMAPIQGSSRLDTFVSLTTTYTVEQFYNMILNKMLNDFRFAAVGWCRDLYMEKS